MYLSLFSYLLCVPVVIECRSLLISHADPFHVKHFEPNLDSNIGYWSPSTSSIDWCERNYVITKYIAEFWNTISSLLMCVFALILFLQGLYYRIENRFLLMSLSFGLVGFGSAYFHGTLTHLGQMFDELPMVYCMIVWWFILFRMNHHRLKNHISPLDVFVIFGIFYGGFWTYIHNLQTFVLIFQIHFTLLVFGGFLQLIYLYHQEQYHQKPILYLIFGYIGFILLATICWIIDQQFCVEMNGTNGLNPQFHAWWHVFCALSSHVGIVCAESMRLLSLKSRINKNSSSQPNNHHHHHHQLRLVFYFGLPFVDYSKEKLI